ncbi:F-box domain-containing protein [Heracleum sosnowskyi]|uniref:F-box domain-containing protein n=1 Tax=Heracleum sosnowskyi TaxID=360622 RepID=A0AAD8GWE7_9APIA|nr:F-box domain-containing protein [Heracleum sosnowskyi]
MALPCELIGEILCLLPVKTLLRCRCVSKQWCSIVDSTYFVQKHHKASIQMNSGGIIMKGVENFVLVDYESLHDDVAAAIEITDPLKTLLSCAELVGSANGLVCLWENLPNIIYLLNPSTRKCKRLPLVPVEFPSCFNKIEKCVCGFGYDQLSDDYKVVKIAKSRKFLGLMAIVYSLENNSWTKIQGVLSTRNISFMNTWGKFAGGALYWQASDVHYSSTIVVGFDLGFEQFTEVSDSAGNDSDNPRTLATLAGILCILEYYYYDPRVDVLLMNNHGEENVWSKEFSVDPGLLGPMNFRPLAYSKSRQEVLLQVASARLVWYNQRNKAVKNVSVPGIPYMFGSYMYNESLFRLTEDMLVPEPSHEAEERKQQTKKR